MKHVWHVTREDNAHQSLVISEPLMKEIKVKGRYEKGKLVKEEKGRNKKEKDSLHLCL